MEVIVTNDAPPLVAVAIASSLAAEHRYRDDIVLDLGAEYRDVLASRGIAAARRWYWREALRIPVRVGPTLRAVALATAAYLGVLAVDAMGGHVLQSNVWEMAVIGTSSVAAGCGLVRCSGRQSVLAMFLLIAITLAVGIPYVLRGWSGERWLHVTKVLLVLTMSAAGAWISRAADTRHPA